MTQEEKTKNFKRIAEKRTNEILAKINTFKNFKNSSFYEVSEEDVDKISRAILEAVKNTILPLKEIKKKWEIWV